MAEASPISVPRAASISAARALIGSPRACAISRNAAQNSSSKDTLVRCPCRVSERFAGRLLILGIVLIEMTSLALLPGQAQQAFGLVLSVNCYFLRRGCALFFTCFLLPDRAEIRNAAHGPESALCPHQKQVLTTRIAQISTLASGGPVQCGVQPVIAPEKLCFDGETRSTEQTECDGLGTARLELGFARGVVSGLCQCRR